MKSLLQNLIYLLIGVYIVKLAIFGELTYYISQRYVIFTTVSGITLLSIFFLNFYKDKNTILKLKNFDLYSAIILIILLLAILIPPVTLSSEAFKQRNIGESVSFKETNSLETRSPFFSDTSKYTFKDWYNTISLTNSFDDLVNREINITGKLVKDSSVPQGFHMITRFVVSCCAVDATPLFIYFKYDNELEENRWIKIKGDTKTIVLNGKEVLYADVTFLEYIETPNDPYNL